MGSRGGPIFDVDLANNSELAFQDFSNTADLGGSINNTGSPSLRGGDLYGPDRALGSALSGSATKQGGVLSIDYYGGWFDVDTKTVLTRCWKTMVPWPAGEDFVVDVLAGVPDLYGPFWVPTTLIFSLFLTSSLTTSVSAYLEGRSYAYDFTRLGAAVSLVYTYYGIVPTAIWAGMKYWAGVHERGLVEVLSLYGYSSSVWVLMSWLALAPPTPLRLFLTFTATCLSLYFLVRNLYPTIATSTNTSSRLLIVVIAVLHLAMAIVLFVGFLEGGTGKFSPPDAAKGGAGDSTTPPVDGETLRRLFF